MSRWGSERKEKRLCVQVANWSVVEEDGGEDKETGASKGSASGES
jgi:hypothetical protein